MIKYHQFGQGKYILYNEGMTDAPLLQERPRFTGPFGVRESVVFG